MTKSPVFFAAVSPQAPLEELREALARQLAHAESLGLGRRDYDLVRI